MSLDLPPVPPRRRPAGPPERRRRVPYGVSLAATVLVLGGLTVAFVLIVLPQRYVFQSGLRASGVSFPAQGAPFGTAELVMVDPVPRLGPATAPAAAPDEADVEAPPPPGPAEALWASVGPLLQQGEEPRALPLFEAYLRDHPDDASARLEYAIALVRADRTGEAEAAFREVIDRTGDARARLEYAHLLRDRGEPERAAALYRELSRERPGDDALRLELARTLAAAGSWDEAEAAYQALLDESPGRHDLRLELARGLWTADRAGDAYEVVAAVPTGAPERVQAENLRSLLVLALGAVAEEPGPPPAPEEARPADRLERARAAAYEGRVGELLALYREERAEEPADAERLLEWADLVQHHAEDLELAREILEARAELEEPTPELRFRLGQLYAWTGREAAAADELERVVQADPEHAEAWALLGDVRRWRGTRPASAEAYRRALELRPGEPSFLAGREALSEATFQAIAGREDPGLGPTLSFFRDSEGFRRLDLTARGTLLRGQRDALGLRSGMRRLEGFRSDGSPGAEEGAFAELELSRWWREGTVRAFLGAGVENLDDAGTEASVSAGLDARDLNLWDLEVFYQRGRAYSLLTTLETVDLAIRADRLAIAIERPLGERWALAAGGDAGSFRGAGQSSLRAGAHAGLHRTLRPGARLGLTSRVLTYTDPAPIVGERRTFWDPELFWSTELPLELESARWDGWSGHLRLSPGMALLEDRGSEEGRWIGQLTGEAGTRYRTDRLTLDASLFSTRGREGDYDAFGARLHFTIRP